MKFKPWKNNRNYIVSCNMCGKSLGKQAPIGTYSTNRFCGKCQRKMEQDKLNGGTK